MPLKYLMSIVMMEHSLLVKKISIQASPRSPLLSMMQSIRALLPPNMMIKDLAKCLNSLCNKTFKMDSLVLTTTTQECIQKDAIETMELIKSHKEK